MKRLILIVIIAAAIGIGWYLGAPLFTDRTVDEALPTSSPNAAPPASPVNRPPSVNEPAEPPPPGATKKNDGEKMVDVTVRGTVGTRPAPEPLKPAAPPAPALVTLRSGTFRDADPSHQGSGRAVVYRLASGQRVLRLENFSVTNGPDLRVLLSRHPQPTSHFVLESTVELATLKGNRGNQNYDIPADLDLDAFRSVVIYCKPFRVIFSTATLTGA